MIEQIGGSRMIWRYGVVKTTADNGETIYAIHELFFEEDGAVSWTAEPVTFEADTLKDLTAQITMAAKDISMCRLSGLSYLIVDDTDE